MYNFHICITLLHCLNNVFGYSVILFIPVVVVLANTEDTTSLMIEAQKQGLMNGEYVFLLVQQFEVSGKVVSKWYKENAGEFVVFHSIIMLKSRQKYF